MKKGLTIWVIVLVTIAKTAIAQKMTVKDSDLHVLMEVNDEGDVGSITLPSGSAPGTTTNKLYNVGGALYWNGSQLGTAGSGGGWTDDGTVVRLSTGTDKVGIGVTTPAYPLDVDSTIGISNTQVLYRPNQSKFTGTLYLGNGGSSLSHTSGDDGEDNTAVGIGALNANTTGYRNTASGSYSMYKNTTGYSNTAIGANALYSNTEGDDNTALGYSALYKNTEGHSNTASGKQALGNNTTGEGNTASGSHSLRFNTTGYENTAVGSGALFSNTTGNYNTGIGYYANAYNQAGSRNTIIGYQAGYATPFYDKSGNVFIGYQAGYNETGDNKLYIENSNSPTPLIGGDFSANEIYLNGNVGIGKTSPDSELDVNGEIRSTYGFFHDRGDATSCDKTVVDWTKDGSWYDWDLSGVVPEGTKGIVIWGYIKSSVAGEFFMLRKNGNSNEYNLLQCQTQAAGIEICFQGVVPCDTNRIIEYKFENTGHWTDAAAVVVGWFK